MQFAHPTYDDTIRFAHCALDATTTIRPEALQAIQSAPVIPRDSQRFQDAFKALLEALYRQTFGSKYLTGVHVKDISLQYGDDIAIHQITWEADIQAEPCMLVLTRRKKPVLLLRGGLRRGGLEKGDYGYLATYGQVQGLHHRHCMELILAFAALAAGENVALRDELEEKDLHGSTNLREVAEGLFMLEGPVPTFDPQFLMDRYTTFALSIFGPTVVRQLISARGRDPRDEGASELKLSCENSDNTLWETGYELVFSASPKVNPAVIQALIDLKFSADTWRAVSVDYKALTARVRQHFKGQLRVHEALVVFHSYEDKEKFMSQYGSDTPGVFTREHEFIRTRPVRPIVTHRYGEPK